MTAALRRYAAVIWLVAIGLAVVGAVSIFSLPSGIYPEMKFPRVVVVAHLGQLAPELVDAQVTRPLEEVLATVEGVRHVKAKTIRGAVELSLQLTDQANPLQVRDACQARIDRADLPAGTTTVAERVLPTAVPIITFNLSAAKGTTADPRHLRDVAERIVRPAFVRLGGVGGVELQGGRVRQAVIQIRPTELAALHITPSQLATKLVAADVLVATGRVFDQHQTLPVVLDAQAVDFDQLKALPIASGPSGPVPLSAVADVVEGAADPDIIVRGKQGESVAIGVTRLPGASTVDVVDRVLTAAKDLRAQHTLPTDVELTPVYDQAELVNESLASVRDAILIGIALSLLVISLSLRNLRAGLIAALPVPVTLLGTFAIMRWFGVTLNVMSLGGLAVAIGLVVDDAIVVTEGIVARMEERGEGGDPIELGVRDMFAAVIGTTFTTVVVFAPLALLTGITGSFLGAFAVTLVIAVLLSLILALTLIPLLASHLHQHKREVKEGGRDRLAKAIRWLVHRRFIAVAVVVALGLAGYLAQRGLATGFLPAMDEGAFVIDFTLPAGTSLEETDQITQGVDRVLAAMPEVVEFARRTGTELGPATATLQNTGDIMVKLVPRDRRAGVDEVIDKVREELHGKVPEARFEFIQVLQDVLADLAGNPQPIEIRALGDDPAALDEWAKRAGEQLEKRPELVDFFDGREGLTPILRTRIDQALLSRLGLDAATVGEDLDVALRGKEIGQIIRPERVISVMLRYPDAVRFSAPALAQSSIAYGPGSLPLGQIVHQDRPMSRTVLRRDGLRGALVMHASTPGGDLGAAVAAVHDVIRKVRPPEGTQIEIGGQAASGEASRRELRNIAGLALLLVLLVLLVQLRSLGMALVVLVSAPLAAVGSLLVMWATGTPLNISSLTGLILLVGLVVKNGILLLEYALRRVGEGMSLEHALAAAARRRMRPVLMTTAATLAGLTPLAIGIGAGAELQQPLAIAVMGGLVFSTIVSLVVTPGLAALLAGRHHRASDATAASSPSPP